MQYNNFIEDLKNKLNNKSKELDDAKIDTERWKLKCENLMGKYKENKVRLMLMNDTDKMIHSQDNSPTPRNLKSNSKNSMAGDH